MTKDPFIPSIDMYRTIIDMVVEGEDSPYQQLMRKTNDIDMQYFEGIRRDTEAIPSELNMALMDKVVNDFRKMADELFEQNDLDKQIIQTIKSQTSNVKDTMGEEALQNYLASLSNALRDYAKGMMLKGDGPQFTHLELQEKYEAAQRVTLKERIMKDNKADVIDFYHALMDTTWWECREIVVQRTRTFLQSLADNVRKVSESAN